MEKYKILIKKSVSKDLKKLPRIFVKAVLEKIQTLSENPRPIGSQKLSSEEKYRLRCGELRILYMIEDETQIVTIVKVAHRKDVYRKK